ncbi:MAG: hypothetical protein R2820_06185 [Cyclobacteriaceae bacterium]
MKQLLLPFLALLLLTECSEKRPTDSNTTLTNESAANQFVDAFYSFDKDSLEKVLTTAKGSQSNLLYYQKWAECGHYEIVKRGEIIHRSDTLVLVPVTVKDDLMSALKINFNVTDTFRIVIVSEKIRSVDTSSNDPDSYYEAKEWVKNNMPELIDTECEGIWNGGPTPCGCINGYIEGFHYYVKAMGAEPL